MKSVQSLRQLCRQNRQQLSKQQQFEHARSATQILLRSHYCQRPKKIALFLAQDGELSTDLLTTPLRSRGHQLYLPIVKTLRGRYNMLFAPYTEKTPLKPNQFGILEPDLLSQQQYLTGKKLDLVLTPLTCFDESGNRTGMGGGFYDRTFAFKKLSPTTNNPELIGWAHECQKVDKIIPEIWDVPLDGLITENRLIKF